MGQISHSGFATLRVSRENPTAVLVLSDGTVFPGFGFGATTTNVGEVCFNTSMTGYQEIMTDPSYAGQIMLDEPFIKARFGTPASRISYRLAGNHAQSGGRDCLVILGVGANIADMGKGKGDDLARIGRISHDLLIACH